MKLVSRIFSRSERNNRSNHSRRIALVLSGGGARGLAHIGAIAELEARGYTIEAIAGTSIGAMVGGFYAAGRLDALRDWALSMRRRDVYSMIDVTLAWGYIMKGERYMLGVRKRLLGARIEALPIPFCAIATNVTTGQEEVFRKGDLATAIRASVSLPGLLRPVRIGKNIYVDGGVLNQLPLNHVERPSGTRLFAVDASAPSAAPFNSFTEEEPQIYGSGIISTLRSGLSSLHLGMRRNYFNLGLRVSSLAVQSNAELTKQLFPPDLLVNIPQDRYSTLDFHQAKEIIEGGQRAMRAALDSYEALQSP